jgi:acetyl-CoA/propionyl-CoA carboxylase biotin carboxyl carrier protein
VRLESGDVARSVPADGPTGRLEVALDNGVAYIDVLGRSVPFRLAPPPDVDRAARAAASHVQHGRAAEIVAPMPGAVLTVHVAAGTAVAAGDPIVTLEAMKMEHVVAAPIDGTVADVHVRPAEQVVRGQALATIES